MGGNALDRRMSSPTKNTNVTAAHSTPVIGPKPSVFRPRLRYDALDLQTSIALSTL